MLLEPVRIRRPDLRDEVRDLIAMVCADGPHQEIPLTELVRILGISIAPDFQDQLAERGDLRLLPDRFENEGPEILRKVRLLGFDVKLVIPPRLSGQLRRQDGGFALDFRPGQSVAIRKLLFHVQLRQLELSEERIFVDFTGAQDVFIDLR